DSAPTTVSFAPVTAQRFRIVLAPRTPAGPGTGDPAPGADPGIIPQLIAAAAGAPLQVRQARLGAEPVIDRFETKAGFA
ncbi:hypothetical protein ABTC22_19030, partial [Acinetobacter baumannii]